MSDRTDQSNTNHQLLLPSIILAVAIVLASVIELTPGTGRYQRLGDTTVLDTKTGRACASQSTTNVSCADFGERVRVREVSQGNPFRP